MRPDQKNTKTENIGIDEQLVRPTTKQVTRRYPIGEPSSGSKKGSWRQMTNEVWLRKEH